MNQNKIAVIGAGAIGSVIGGLLSRAGEDVTLIGRRDHVDAINKQGLTIDGALGEMKVWVKAQDHLDFKPDMVLLTVKTQDVEVATREIKSHVSGVPIVTLQNGVWSDEIAAGVLGKENIVSGVVLFGSTFLEPGRVTYSPKGVIAVGEAFSPNGKRVENIAAILNKAVPTHVAKDIQGAHWTKLIMNLNNALPAITGMSIQEIGAYSKLRELSIFLIKEGMNTIELASIKLRSLPRLPVFIVKLVFNMPLPVASRFLGLLTKSMGTVPVMGSTLQSIRRGKSTEIDYLNGEIVALGKKLGISTPYNISIVEMVHQVEATGKFLKIEEMLAAVENNVKA